MQKIQLKFSHIEHLAHHTTEQFCSSLRLSSASHYCSVTLHCDLAAPAKSRMNTDFWTTHDAGGTLLLDCLPRSCDLVA